MIIKQDIEGYYWLIRDDGTKVGPFTNKKLIEQGEEQNAIDISKGDN